MANTETAVENLIVNKLSRAKYIELSSSTGLQADQIYIITDPTLDASSHAVSNVAEPVLSTDAATKNYVDTEIAKIDVSDQLTSYYTKTQVNDISSYLNGLIESNESTPLVGKSYDLSQNGMFTKLVVDIGRALGATITNSPVDGLLASSIIDSDDTRFGN